MFGKKYFVYSASFVFVCALSSTTLSAGTPKTGPAYAGMKHTGALLKKLGWNVAACRAMGHVEVATDAAGKQFWGKSWRCLASRRLQVAVVDLVQSKHKISKDVLPVTGVNLLSPHALLNVRVFDQGLAEELRRRIAARGMTQASIVAVMKRMKAGTLSPCRSCDPEIAETYMCCTFKLKNKGKAVECAIGLAVYSDLETARGNVLPLHSKLSGKTVLTLSIEDMKAARGLLKRIVAAEK